MKTRVTDHDNDQSTSTWIQALHWNKVGRPYTHIAHLESMAKVDHVVSIADGRLLSKENLALLEKIKKQYIIAAQFKSQPEIIFSFNQ